MLSEEGVCVCVCTRVHTHVYSLKKMEDLILVVRWCQTYLKKINFMHLPYPMSFEIGGTRAQLST